MSSVRRRRARAAADRRSGRDRRRRPSAPATSRPSASRSCAAGPSRQRRTGTARPVAVVSQSMARTLLAGRGARRPAAPRRPAWSPGTRSWASSADVQAATALDGRAGARIYRPFVQQPRLFRVPARHAPRRSRRARPRPSAAQVPPSTATCRSPTCVTMEQLLDRLGGAPPLQPGPARGSSPPWPWCSPRWGSTACSPTRGRAHAGDRHPHGPGRPPARGAGAGHPPGPDPGRGGGRRRAHPSFAFSQPPQELALRRHRGRPGDLRGDPPGAAAGGALSPRGSPRGAPPGWTRWWRCATSSPRNGTALPDTPERAGPRLAAGSPSASLSEIFMD